MLKNMRKAIKLKLVFLVVFGVLISLFFFQISIILAQGGGEQTQTDWSGGGNQDIFTGNDPAKFQYSGNINFTQQPGEITLAKTPFGWASEQRVSNAISQQNAPQIVPVDTDTAIVVWEDFSGWGAPNWTTKIDAQKINRSDGTSLWQAGGIVVAGEGTYAQAMHFDAVPSGDGGVIVIWDSGDSYSVYVKKINGDGSVAWGGDDGILIVNNLTHSLAAKIASDGTGNYIIVWDDWRDNINPFGYPHLYAQKINSSGIAQWMASGIPIQETETVGQGTTYLVTDGNGGVYVFWNDYRNAGNGSDIYGQRINETCNPGGDVRCWDATGGGDYDGVLISGGGGDQLLQNTISDGNSGAMLAWKDNRSGDYDIYAQKVDGVNGAQVNNYRIWDAGGGVYNGILVAGTGADGNQSFPTLTLDGQGGIVVAWVDLRNGNNDIYAQRINSSGVAQWTANGEVVCDEAHSQNYPQIAPAYSGGNLNGFYITWIDDRTSPGSSNQVYAQKIDLSGDINSEWSTMESGLNQGLLIGDIYLGYFKIAPFTASNESLIVWSNGNGTIYAQKLGAAHFYSTGYLGSSFFDSGGPVGGEPMNWKYIKWKIGSLPAGSSIAFRTRSTDDFLSYEYWTNLSPIEINPSGEWYARIRSGPKRYLQYEATLTANSLEQSPQLSEVSISYTTDNPPNIPSPSRPQGGDRYGFGNPTFTFSQSDSDVNDQLKYQIQITDAADTNFSNTIINYTSELLPQGNASFQVGQAAGSGSYAPGKGSEGQTLPEAGYIWRVRSIDGEYFEGDWTETGNFTIANSLPTITNFGDSWAGGHAHTFPGNENNRPTNQPQLDFQIVDGATNHGEYFSDGNYLQFEIQIAKDSADFLPSSIVLDYVSGAVSDSVWPVPPQTFCVGDPACNGNGSNIGDTNPTPPLPYNGIGVPYGYITGSNGQTLDSDPGFVYYWRVRAADEHGVDSGWVNACVNQCQNQPPHFSFRLEALTSPITYTGSADLINGGTNFNLIPAFNFTLFQPNGDLISYLFVITKDLPVDFNNPQPNLDHGAIVFLSPPYGPTNPPYPISYTLGDTKDSLGNDYNFPFPPTLSSLEIGANYYWLVVPIINGNLEINSAFYGFDPYAAYPGGPGAPFNPNTGTTPSFTVAVESSQPSAYSVANISFNSLKAATPLAIGTNVNGEIVDTLASANSVDFGEPTPGDNKITGFSFNVESNNPHGYTMLIQQDHDMASKDEKFVIEGFNNNGGTDPTNANPQPWVSPDPAVTKGFLGYTTTSTALSGVANRFSLGEIQRYAKLSSIPAEISRSSGPVDNDEVKLLLKLEINSRQESADYSNHIIVTVVSNL